MNQSVARSVVAACTASLLFLAPGVARVEARVGNPDVVPASSVYVFCVPDTAACWAAIKGNALYESLWKLLQQPRFAAQMDEMQRQLKDVEAGLGFGLDPESLSKVASALDVFIEAGKIPGEVNGALVLKVADRARLDKLVALLEKAAERALAPDDSDATTGTDAASKPEASIVKRRERDGVTISEYSLGGMDSVFSATEGDTFVVGNSEAVVLAAIGRAKAPGKGFGSRSDYRSVSGKLGGEGHVFIYADQQAALGLGGPVPEEVERAQVMLREMFPFGLSGSAVTFRPAAVTYRNCTQLTGDGAANWATIGKRYPSDKPMEIVAYAPADTSLVVATSILDVRAILNAVRTLAENLGTVDLDTQLAQAEKTLGFSVTRDLIPALGNEIGLFVNSFRMSGGMPQVDAALVIGVADGPRMKKVLLAMEKAVEAQSASNPMVTSAAPDRPDRSPLKTMTDGPLTIRYAELPFGPGFSPCYALDGNYLLFATNTDSLKRLVSVKGSGSGLPSSEALRVAGPGVSTRAHLFQFMNLGQVLDVALQVAEATGADLGEAKALISGLTVLDTAVSSAVLGPEGVVTEGIITLKR